MRKLILECKQSPGDVLTLTAAIESLHQTYPGEYITDYKGTCSELFDNNPWITKIPDEEGELISMHYPSVHRSNQEHVSFLDGYTRYLSTVIDRPLRLITNKPHLYLSDDEKNWMNQVQQYHTNFKQTPFWLINVGTKKDFTAKQWPIEYYQKVVDETCGLIQWIQIGANEHDHHPLRGVISLVGETDHRQLIRLVYSCNGGLGPSTYLQHLCAAFEKQYLCLLGGREPLPWVTYPRQTTFHTIGQLKCCQHGACWKSRVVPLPDNDEKNNSLCEIPILGYMKPVGKCMAIIKPEEIISVLRRIHNQSL